MGIENMIATVQIYIHHRKNKEVDIKINSDRDLMLLMKAYKISINWLNSNGFKQIL